MTDRTVEPTGNDGLRDPVRPPSVFIAFAAIWGIGFASQALSPALVNNLVQNGGYSPAQAGLIQSIELLAAALASLGAAPFLGRVSKRRMALSGGVLALAMHLASCIPVATATLCLFRAFAGLGAGLALAAGNALVAESAEPERMYARIMMITATAYGCLFPIFGNLGVTWGAFGVYGLEAAWALIVLPFLWRMPGTTSLRGSGEQESSALPILPTCLMVGGFLLFEICDVGVWSFSEHVASRIGIKASDSSLSLAGSSAIAIAGSFLASKIGFRLGRALPLLFGLFCFASTCSLIISSSNATVFTLSILSYQGVYAFTLPFLYGIAGGLDQQGRSIAACSGGALIGASIGPYVFGRASEHADNALLVSSILLVLAGVAVLIFGALFFRRRMEAGASMPPKGFS